MTQRLHTDPETTGRLLHQQLLAEARREVRAWEQGHYPLRVPAPVHSMPGPMTEPMPAAVPTTQPGKHRSSVLTRLRPRGLTLIAGLTATMAHLADAYTDTAAGLLT